MRLELSHSVVREWSSGDLASLVRHADNWNVWINLRDRFPHPYSEQNGSQFLGHVAKLAPVTVWAIEVDGEAAGGIGLEMLNDVDRMSAEIGYWLGEAFWNRGVMSEAVRAFTEEAFRRFDITRIFALPFAHNHGSIRVLEKAGYVLEGRMPQSAIKNGEIRDQAMYGAYKSLAGRQVG